MKAGDLIRLPCEEGFAIVVRVIKHNPDHRNPAGSTSVAVLREFGEDYWDAGACEIISESR